MKKETKFSIITFIVVALVAYIAFSFIPDVTLENATANGSIFTILGNGIVNLVGMRVILALSFAIIVTLLIRIVDTDEKTTKKPQQKVTTKKEAK